MKKILFATDLSEICEAPFHAAIDIAKKGNRWLYVVHILESAHLGRHRSFVKDIWTDEEHSATSEYVEKVKGLIRDMYVPKMNGFANYSIEVRPGFPYTEILRTASREHIDLIIMAPHTGMAEIKGVSRTCGRVGSTLEGVTTGAHCPVMVVPRPPKRTDSFERILVATDFSKCGNYAFGFALGMAKKSDARLFILTVSERMPTVFGVRDHAGSSEEIATERYGSKLTGFEDYVIEGAEGVAHMEILKFARAQDADLIVMGAHARQEDPAWCPDDTVDTVAEVSMRSPCPVIAVCAREALHRI
ncbi:MAG: universal stress protein [Deltaproteobacteria bacterium]|nr:universal stress protein [Deltaproteobacteria bacterium]